MTSVVYFAKSGRYVKIGFTKNLKSRMSSLGTSCPEGIEILATVPGGIELETIIHAKLAEHRSKREWFEDVPAVRDLMAELIAGNKDAFVPPPAPEPEPEPLPDPDEDDDGDISDVLFGDITRRFAALNRLPLITEVFEARAMERKLSLEKGALMFDLIDGPAAAKQLHDAIGVLHRNFSKFVKVTDRLMIATFDRSIPEAPLRRAAEILIGRTEASFAAVKAKRPDLQFTLEEAAQ